MKRRLLSYLLVLIQFLTLGYLAWTGPLLARSPLLLLLEALAVALGLWAIWSMKPGHFNITPDVRPGAQLVRQGPYRFIRHPMYSALLLGSLALVAAHATPGRVAAWLLLVIDLLLKLHHEERLLAEAFPDYPAYRRTTWRLVPFVY
ncbi:hypothetical protein FKZ61_009985 [Litorilinea aerophila]|uniref:Isoprenylcysteine carboxylmethyltransferase family protein n=1 Tax=Litorilinea aerophila TaxID=1204385 RepID=A0A540VH02_9CHLR|nr:isoprenylcysteine carboxylmethyltransferase family protein [Litorilinea aerophila]MCC9076436.1 hypothetical protein [Litorilinea aerophila]OUC08828.1 hypothetical protein RY27_06655 [Litorilinea aerophila]GIV79082.1 MAG: isoprenylcysteine carboxyl methyltransferase [Litorilinea sp.]